MRMTTDNPESISRMIIWLDGYVTAAHGKDSIPYFSLIRRVLLDRKAALAALADVKLEGE